MLNIVRVLSILHHDPFWKITLRKTLLLLSNFLLHLLLRWLLNLSYLLLSLWLLYLNLRLFLNFLNLLDLLWLSSSKWLWERVDDKFLNRNILHFFLFCGFSQHKHKIYWMLCKSYIFFHCTLCSELI